MKLAKTPMMAILFGGMTIALIVTVIGWNSIDDDASRLADLDEGKTPIAMTVESVGGTETFEASSTKPDVEDSVDNVATSAADLTALSRDASESVAPKTESTPLDPDAVAAMRPWFNKEALGLHGKLVRALQSAEGDDAQKQERMKELVEEFRRKSRERYDAAAR